MKRFKLIARDYGLAFGLDRAVRELVDMERLSALAVITSSELWNREALELAQLIAAQRRQPEIGLTLCLTAPFSPLSERAFSQFGSHFPTPFKLQLNLAIRRIPKEVLLVEIAEQIESFIHTFNMMPEFIDSWRDVHLLPPVRDAIRTYFARQAELPRPWLARTSKWGFRDRLLCKADTEAGMPIGSEILTAPLSQDPARIRKFFYSGLDFAPEDTAVYVCPAIPDDRLRRFDRRIAERQVTWQFLASDEFERLLLAKDLFVY